MVTELARKDVQERSDREQLREFFTSLGYDTDHVSIFTFQSSNITQGLRQRIRHIKRA